MRSKLYWLLATCATLVSSPAQAEQYKLYIYSGSGFFINHDGYLVTNAHVVHDCERITAVGSIGDQEVTLVARDEDADLALLRYQGNISDPVTFSSLYHPLQVGDRVLTVGFPGDAYQTLKLVTHETQLVSLTGPQGESKWLQLGNVVEKGNSGGPLLDSTGNLTGVITAHAEIYTYRQDQPNNGTLSQAGIAISLPVLEDFLQAHGARYSESDAVDYYSADRISDAAARYTVNVRCEYKRERIN